MSNSNFVLHTGYKQYFLFDIQDSYIKKYSQILYITQILIVINLLFPQKKYSAWATNAHAE
jgi:hypothetical protein